MSSLILQKRDFLFLKKLFSFGLMNTDQINRGIFFNIEKTTTLRRLRKLKKYKLIQKTLGLDHGAYAWSITSKGAQLIGEENGAGTINHNKLAHDILVSEVRLRLEEKSLCRNFKTKMNSDSEFEKIPDGLAIFKIGGEFKIMAVEVELNLKSKSRYRSVLLNYSNKQSIDAVWYIVSEEKIAKSIERIKTQIYRARKSEWIYFSTVEDFFSNNDKTTLWSYSGQPALALERVEITDQSGAQQVSKLSVW